LQIYVIDLLSQWLDSGRIVALSRDRYRYGELISTSFVESTVNYVLSKRFVKKQ